MQQNDDHGSLSRGGDDYLNERVAPVSLVNDIAERFRLAVISGALRPGDEINESQLAERLGVARGTLREAVRILIGEGLFEKLPNRASRVRKLSPEKIWEIMTARAVIEGFGARVLAQRVTPDKVQTLNRLWEGLDAAAQANDWAGFVHWDFCLHQAIMELSGHGVLLETWTRMSAWVRLMFATERYLPYELLTNAASHKAIVDAIASGNPDLAEARLKADLLDQKELERFAGLAEVLSAPRHPSPGGVVSSTYDGEDGDGRR